MTINENLSEYAGYRVVPWNPGDPLGDTATTIHRISNEWDDEMAWVDKFRAFLALPGVGESRGFVVGWWGQEESDEPSGPVVEALASAHAGLPKLHALFFGDVTYEENEVSWIQNSSMAPLLAAYPQLTHFGVRGGNDLSLGRLDSPVLRELIVQAGGLSAEVVREIMTAKLPALEHLEIYLGTDNYGATSSADDLTPILDGKLFPNLKYLGLKNSDYQDQIAQMIVNAPVLDGLETLDLSMGVLTDEGGQALLGSEKIRKLKKLDLQHHFFTPDMIAKVGALGPIVDLSDAQNPEDEWRFVALGE